MKLNCFLLILPAVFWAGCGSGSDLPAASEVVLSLTPISITTTTEGSVPLQATVSGFTSTPFLDWWMQEQHDAGSTAEEDCDSITAANQNLIPTCKFGYIVIDSMQQNSTSATYYAPKTPGTYHVTIRAVQLSTRTYGGSVEKRSTAAITVQ
jgi:hypothetical protein